MSIPSYYANVAVADDTDAAVSAADVEYGCVVVQGPAAVHFCDSN